MRKYDKTRKGALLAMVIFFVLAAIFFALGFAFFRAVGGVFFALCLLFFMGGIGSAAQFFPEPAKKKSGKKQEKEDALDRLFFYDAADDDF